MGIKSIYGKAADQGSEIADNPKGIVRGAADAAVDYYQKSYNEKDPEWIADKGSMFYNPTGAPHGLSRADAGPTLDGRASKIFLPDQTAETIDELLGDAIYTPEMKGLMIGVGFWEFVITQYTEVHADVGIRKNVFGDAFLGLATGASPLQISIVGYVSTTPTRDHRLDFLTMYNLLLRGTQAQKSGVPVGFNLKKTFIYLDITNIQMGTAAAMPDWTALTISGIGYNYKVFSDIANTGDSKDAGEKK